MAATISKDDPMDLGPFLKEYVLNNPFTSLSPNPSPPPPPPRKYCFPPNPRVKPRQVPSPTVISVRRDNNGSPVLAPVNHGNHLPVLAVKALPVVSTPPVVQQVAPIIHPPNSLSPCMVGGGLVGGGLPGGIKREPGLEPGVGGGDRMLPLGGTDTPNAHMLPLGGTDTPKAHIGSNKHFAAMLREMKLPRKHNKVKKWLFTYYRHIPNSPEWLSSEDLLEHAHTLFESLKSNVMSRIMKVTFPNCHKVVNKYGYFYIGLLRRPEAKHCVDESLRLASRSVMEGQCTPDYAAQIHNCSAQVINRMVGWYDVINDPVPAQTQVLSDTGSDETEEEAPDASVSPADVRMRLQEKARSNLNARGKLKGKSKNDKTWSPRGRPRPYDVNGSRMHLRKRSNESNENGIIKEEEEDMWSEDDGEEGGEWRMELDDVTGSGSDATRSNASPLPVITAIGTLEVKIKDEPVDPGYEMYEKNNNNSTGSEKTDNNNSNGAEDSTVKESFNTLRTLLNVNTSNESATSSSPLKGSESENGQLRHSPLDGSSGVGTSGASSGRNASLSSVVDHLTMKQELQKTKDELRHKTKQNVELEKRLTEAHVEIQDLQSNLAGRENQISDLASEFFELSNKFMKLTHKFKQALAEPIFNQTS